MMVGDEHKGPRVVVVVVDVVVVVVVNKVVVAVVVVVVEADATVELVSPLYVVVEIVIEVVVNIVVVIEVVVIVLEVDVEVVVDVVDVVVVCRRKDTVALTPLRRGPVPSVLNVMYIVVPDAIIAAGTTLPLKLPSSGAVEETPS